MMAKRGICGSFENYVILALLLAVLVLHSAGVAEGKFAARPKPNKCDISKGQWVKRNSPPQYTGLGCKRLIRLPWNCQLNNRSDVSYAQYKWQPSKCSLPDFNATRFSIMMRGKVVAVIGDSLMSNFVQSLYCLLNATLEVNVVRLYFGGLVMHGVDVPKYKYQVVYVASNYLMKASIVKADGAAGKAGGHSYQVDLDELAPEWRAALPFFSVVVFNTGHWYSMNVPGRTAVNQFRVGGKRVYLDNISAYKLALKYVGDYLVKTKFRGIPYYVTYSPSHRDPLTEGETVVCGSRVPLTASAAAYNVSMTGANSYYSVERAAFSYSNSIVRLLSITTLSALRPDSHLGFYWRTGKKQVGDRSDCTHWCLPGLPDTWSDVLFSELLREPSLPKGVI